MDLCSPVPRFLFFLISFALPVPHLTPFILIPNPDVHIKAVSAVAHFLDSMPAAISARPSANKMPVPHTDQFIVIILLTSHGRSL